MSVRKNDECCKESAKKGAQAMHDIMKSELEQERKKSAKLVEALEKTQALLSNVSKDSNTSRIFSRYAINEQALKKYKGESE